MPNIEIADKPTLDSVKSDTEYIIAHLPKGGDLDNIRVSVLDFTADEITMLHGIINTSRRTATT